MFAMEEQKQLVDTIGDLSNTRYSLILLGNFEVVMKMVDEKLTVEGLFSIVLYAKAKKDEDGEMKYVFETKTDGANTCKSPMGMFEETEIPNDLHLVKEAITKYEQ